MAMNTVFITWNTSPSPSPASPAAGNELGTSRVVQQHKQKVTFILAPSLCKNVDHELIQRNRITTSSVSLNKYTKDKNNSSSTKHKRTLHRALFSDNGTTEIRWKIGTKTKSV